jgi:hypothetical protein
VDHAEKVLPDKRAEIAVYCGERKENGWKMARSWAA